MSKYTINDVAEIIPVEQTANVVAAIEDYLNNGVIPPPDPCMSCEPNHIRKLISTIQVAERHGLFPPKKVAAPEVVHSTRAKKKAKEHTSNYEAGDIPEEEVEEAKAKRPNLFGESEDK